VFTPPSLQLQPPSPHERIVARQVLGIVPLREVGPNLFILNDPGAVLSDMFWGSESLLLSDMSQWLELAVVELIRNWNVVLVAVVGVN
jgi:hypothetical protein